VAKNDIFVEKETEKARKKEIENKVPSKQFKYSIAASGFSLCSVFCAAILPFGCIHYFMHNHDLSP
jgi:hypothetical protein